MLRLSPRAKKIILAIKRMEYLSAKASLSFQELKELDNIVLALNGLRGDLTGLPAWKCEGEIGI